MRTIDADMLLNNSWNKLGEAEDVVSDLITDLSSSDHYYESPSDAQGFKNFESALLQIQHRILELQANIGLALKSRTKGTIFLKDKHPPVCSVEIITPTEQFKKPELDQFGNMLKESSTITSVSQCEGECGIKYPLPCAIPVMKEGTDATLP